MIPRHRPARCDDCAGTEPTGPSWPNNGIENDELQRARALQLAPHAQRWAHNVAIRR
jgi:hypothetical protein